MTVNYLFLVADSTADSIFKDNGECWSLSFSNPFIKENSMLEYLKKRFERVTAPEEVWIAKDRFTVLKHDGKSTKSERVKTSLLIKYLEKKKILHYKTLID
jgi:hypothetical protein